MLSTNYHRRELRVNILTDYILCHCQYVLTTFKTILHLQLSNKAHYGLTN